MKLNWTQDNNSTLRWRGLGFDVSVWARADSPQDADYVWRWKIMTPQ